MSPSQISRPPAMGMRPVRLVLALVCLAVVAGCGGAHLDPEPVSATAPDGRGAIRPLPAPTHCTRTADTTETMAAALAKARPGDRICLLGDLHHKRLVLNTSGTRKRPIELVGDGRTIVKGITVEASNVRISGLNAVRPRAPGVYLRGNNITLENTTVLSPRGDDGDGIRFFGSYITIRQNTIRDTSHLLGAHADCMQTFATDDKHIASEHLKVTRNRCERISNICLIAEGPNPLAGDGSGQGRSADFTFSDNYCENHASEATEIDDVHQVEITHNEIHGRKPMAWSFQNNATGAVVSSNTIDPAITYEVGMDESSKVGYFGPPVGGKP
ncbi:right-handed parallel beta-helix repeat-containing protein [Pseudonocardia acaciae]|uniref:right-handed parallel beta-helix repeat-containing protein n=1 Tax=Pseudonocardia acaciae TaxID=551276 RepID=UPI0009FCE650|nr:right-handed parallel beta-helix repeat-containing protein [Pseudonocardia acaciae]